MYLRTCLLFQSSILPLQDILQETNEQKNEILQSRTTANLDELEAEITRKRGTMKHVGAFGELPPMTGRQEPC